VHALAVTEKRGTLRTWTALLAICTFSLSLLGTFLVRSGVLSSVHAFAIDPRRGVFILAFLVIVIGGSLALFAARAHKMGEGGRFELVSRESMLLANNVLLAVAAASVLLGTLYPLVLDALAMGKLSVGAPYFDTVLLPLMAPLAFLMGIGPLAHWRQAALPQLWRRLCWALAASVVAALVASLLAGHWRPLSFLGFLLAAWIVTTTIVQFIERAGGGQGNFQARIAARPRAWWGMIAAHLGVAVFIVGVTTVKGFEIERDARLQAGDRLTIAGYTFRFDGVTDVRGPNYRALRGAFDVSRGGDHVATMHPEKRIYDANGLSTTEAAIDSGFLGDRYVSLGEPYADGAWSVRIYHKPFVTWIWLGGLLMAAGGVLAATDRRYRDGKLRASTSAPSERVAED
jgi:cytochrome c-type biogenesis protein CcmF